MIFTVIVPDIEWLVRLVRDFLRLIREAYPDVITSEIKREDTDNG